MNPRHAAALALVGWYLMIPPDNGTGVNIEAPLSKWTVMSAHDTAYDCEEMRIYSFKRANAEQERDAIFRQQVTNSQCIETTDPRLAK